MRKLALAILAAVSLAACTPAAQTSQSRDARRTEDQQQVYEVNQPIPQFQFSQTRDTLIQIYRLENEARLTYTYVGGINGGRPQWSCASRGYAIPADTQLTNPVQLAGAWVPSGSSSGDTKNVNGTYYRWVDGPIDLPEPNGVYSSENTDGTWVLCIRPDGTVHPVYTELKVQTFPFEMRWDAEQQILVDAGQRSSSTVDVRGGTLATPAASPQSSPSPAR